MENISSLVVNLSKDYVLMHKKELNDFFVAYKIRLETEFKELTLFGNNNFNSKYSFNSFGSILFSTSQLDKEEVLRLQKIENSYFGFPFFNKESNKISTRGYVYYISGLKDEEDKKIVRLLSMLEVSINLFKDFYGQTITPTLSTIILLDDIRIKTIILYEFLLANNSNSSLIKEMEIACSQSINIFYRFFRGLVVEGEDVNKFIKGILKLTLMLSNLVGSDIQPEVKLRSYKEADHPVHNLLFCKKLKLELKYDINLIIGIRYGGIELPFLVKQELFPNANIKLVKISGYTENKVGVDIEPDLIRNKNILILDDNILTGRTLQKLIDYLSKYSPKNIFFGCISYSGMKRYHQMIMSDHGAVNHLLLERSCILMESEYTKIYNNKSYKNDNGVFDKIKKQIQYSLETDNFEYKI